jgi:hypothetical protein
MIPHRFPALATLDPYALERLVPRRKGYIAFSEIQSAGKVLGQPVFELFCQWNTGSTYTEESTPSTDWAFLSWSSET